MGQYNRRSCCKSSKVPQIPVIFHLLNRATLFGACCLREYLQLGSTRAKMLEHKVQALFKQGKHAETRGFVLRECGVRLGNITKLMGFMVYSQEGIEFIGICSTSYTSTIDKNTESR